MDIKFKAQKMYYQPNKAAYNLILLAIVTNVVFIVVMCNGIIPNMNIGSNILLNVLYLMFMFFMSEQLKIYSSKWSKVAVFMILFQIYRFIEIPMSYRNELDNSDFYILIGTLVVQAVLVTYAGLMTYKKAQIIEENLPQDERYN